MSWNDLPDLLPVPSLVFQLGPAIGTEEPTQQAIKLRDYLRESLCTAGWQVAPVDPRNPASVSLTEDSLRRFAREQVRRTYRRQAALDIQVLEDEL